MILRTVARRVRALIRLATHSPLNYARGPHSSRANSRDDSHCERAAPFSSRFPNMPRTISEHRVRWTRPCLDIIRSTWAPCTNTEKSPFCYMCGIANYRSVHCQYLSLLLLSALLASFQRVAWLWKNEHRYIPRGKNKYTITRVVPETGTNCTISFPTCYLQNTRGTSVENGSRSWDVSIIRAHFNLSRRLTSP